MFPGIKVLTFDECFNIPINVNYYRLIEKSTLTLKPFKS